MEKKWTVKERPPQEQVNRLCSELNIAPQLAALLAQRGISEISEAERFFKPKIQDLHDPFLMKGMSSAVERLTKAIELEEKILLFGDYDVDGTTSVALLFTVLKQFTEQVDFYIPDRYKEGYGISFLGIDYAAENGQTLMIALDCGTKALDKIAYANEKGINVLVCDHHEPGNILPEAILLNPKQKDCIYPYKELSGCGVGFKLLEAYFDSLSYDKDFLYQQLDLLALSIAADIVPITGENRVLAKLGLDLINSKPRLGVQALLRQAGKALPLNLTNLVFVLAPRINAAGRIHSGKKAVDLLISENKDEVEALATSIEADNKERRLLDESITREALEMIALDSSFELKRSTVVYSDSWHKGVVGIVASRLIENHYRPTIVLTKTEDKYTGSARSIRGFNLHEALDKCSHLLEQYGGHAFAAGMTIHEEKVDDFAHYFNEIVCASLPESAFVPEEIVDEILALDDLFEPNENRFSVPKFKRIIDRMEPFGPGNMKPVFMTSGVFAEFPRLLKDAHLKFKVLQPNTGVSLEAIGFNMGDKMDLLESGEPLSLLFTLETNVWNNKESLQLNVKDIRLTI